jgi:hypothetical protein
MTMWPCITHSCGIGPRLLFAMMWYSCHHALIRLLQMRSNGWLSRRRLPSQVGFEISHATWDSLMEPWWRPASFEIMWCTRLGSMVEKNPFDEQHGHCWQPRSLNVHQYWIPKVIPWCNHIVAFQSLCQLA